MAITIAHSQCHHPALPLPFGHVLPWDHVRLVLGGEWEASVGCLGFFLTLLRCPDPAPSHSFSCLPETG